MLINREKGIVICTPTKTGTETLMGELVKHGFLYMLPKHGRNWPHSEEYPRRVMIIRNPHDRLRSMYRFAVAHGGRNGINFASPTCRDDAGEWCNFTDFLRRHKGLMKAKDWILNYTEIAKIFMPTETWRIEGIADILKAEYGVDDFKTRNVTDSMKAWAGRDDAAKWTKENQRIAKWFTEPDCLNFNYPVEVVK